MCLAEQKETIWAGAYKDGNPLTRGIHTLCHNQTLVVTTIVDFFRAGAVSNCSLLLSGKIVSQIHLLLVNGQSDPQQMLLLDPLGIAPVTVHHVRQWYEQVVLPRCHFQLAGQNIEIEF